MSRVYKSNNVKINEPRKLENIFPANFKQKPKPIIKVNEDDSDESLENDGFIIDESFQSDDELEGPSEVELEAEKIIEEAKDLYKNIISEANKEATEMRDSAYAEVSDLNQRAYKEGYDKGINDANKKIGELVDEAQSLRDFLDQRRKNQMREMEEDVVNLVFDVVRKVIGKELEQTSESVLSIVKNALAKSSFTEKAVLRVSEEDYEIVNENRVQILRSIEGLSELEVISDISLIKGSCIIDTPSGEINASVEVQLRELEKVFEFVLNRE